MPVSASKLVTLAQLQAQAERVKQELAKYTLASELGSLAKKSEISEADLSAALKSVIDGKMDAADSMTTEAINSAIATAIAKSAHARFEKVEKVPSNDEAQDNVLYLVMNAATGYYDIYAKVGEKVVRLDDTTVDLSNYATIEQLNAVSGGIGGTVYALPAPSEANADTIYFLRKNNSEAGKQYRAYKLIHGIFEIVGSAEVDLTSYATRESVAKADDGLIKGIYNNMTASSEKYLGSGNLLLFWTLLKSLLNGHESSINDLLARVKLLELILSADVTGNPYYVTFNTLTDVVVSSGIWNKSDGRIEF